MTRFELLLAAAVGGLGVVGFGGYRWYQASAAGEDVARERAQLVLAAASDWKREHVQKGCPSITQLQRASLLEETARAEDPWGQRYRIRCSEKEVQVLSAGKDGRFETSDDITLGVEPNS